jgi:selenoprotein W-related protein
VDTLLRRFGPEIGLLTGVPGFGGVFDVRVDDQLIWSKDETGEFPEPERIVAEVGSRLSS